MFYRIKVWWERWPWTNIYVVCLNLSTHLPHAALRCPVAESNCADGQMEQPKEQGFDRDILVHSYCHYVEWWSTSVSNTSPHHNVSTTKAISQLHNTLLTLILPAIDTWTTISSIHVEFQLMCYCRRLQILGSCRLNQSSLPGNVLALVDIQCTEVVNGFQLLAACYEQVECLYADFLVQQL